MKRALLTIVAVAAMLSGCDDDPAAPTQLQGRRIYAVDTDNNLVLFGSGSPGTISRRSAIQGLQAGEQVVGIDFRPTIAAGVPASELGALYGVTTASRVIKIDTATAVATVIGSLTSSGSTFPLWPALPSVWISTPRSTARVSIPTRARTCGSTRP